MSDPILPSAVPDPDPTENLAHPFPPRLVRASAGSGKTYTLVHRVIGLLAAGVEPDRILATTFTRKAAGEILGRILLRLAECVGDPKALKEVRREMPGVSIDAPGAARILGRTCAILPRLQIQTIDAFFHRIAAAHAFELGLPPDWRIGDTATLADLRRRSIHDLLGADPDAAVELMHRLRRGESARSVTEQIAGLVSDLHHRYLESPPQAWDSFPVPPAPGAEEIREARDALAALPLPITKKGTPPVHWTNARKKLLEAVDRENDESLLENGLVGKILAGETHFSRMEIDPIWETRLAPILDGARHRLLAQLRGQNLASLELIRAFDGRQEARRDASGIYDFQTLTVRLAAEAMLERLRTGLQPIYDRIDARIDHVLLDEFQDTSLFQFLVLRPIIEELLADHAAQRTFFCVGDMKQAIYSWRGGRRALFDEVAGLLPPSSEETFQHSWRSSPVILDTVNQVFESVGGALVEEVDRRAATRWQDAFAPHESKRPKRPGFAELRFARPLDALREPEWGALCRLSAAAKQRLIFEEALALVEEVRSRDPSLSIGLLLRKNRGVAPLIDLLRGRGIDASQEGGNPLSDSLAVNAVLAAFHFADHPGDGAARFVVSRTPLGPLLGLAAEPEPDRDAEAARRLRRQLIEEGAGATVRRLAFALAPACDERDRIRLEQLIELTTRIEPELALRPESLVERIRSTPIESPTSSPVQVMTLHRSKGLEFDVVILPELADSWSQPSPTLLAAHSDPAAPADRISRYMGKSATLLCPDALGPLQEGHREELVTECLNLLYVGMTRAVHALHMLLPPLKMNEGASFARVLRATLGGERTGDLPESAGVLFSHGDRDWLAARPSARGAEERSATAPRSASPPPAPVPDRLPTPVPLPPSLAGADEGSPSTELPHTERRERRELGTVVHALLEGIEWLPSASDLEPSLAAARRTPIPRRGPAARVEQAAERIRTALGAGEAGALFDPEATRDRLSSLAGAPVEEVECARELQYGRIDPKSGEPGRGIIDRIHLARANGRVVAAEVIDAKTTGWAEPTPEQAELTRVHVREAYTEQLLTYRDAVVELFGLTPEQVALWILVLPSGAVVEITGEGS
jgi:ATP-dependent helicase/nuclease subunit A